MHWAVVYAVVVAVGVALLAVSVRRMRRRPGECDTLEQLFLAQARRDSERMPPLRPRHRSS